ncbi:hypothetical protein HC928_02255 [bacterium]|nr:hypothetical protein [bacterium]
MPCKYEATPEELRAAEERRIENAESFKKLKADFEQLVEDYQQLLEKQDKLTKLLCTACNLLSQATPEMSRHPRSYVTDSDIAAMFEWWKAHIDQDRERLNVLREQALAKLTEEERDALLGATSGA